MKFLVVYYLIQFKFTFGTKAFEPWLISTWGFKGQNLEDFSTRLEKIVSYVVVLAFTTIVVHIHKLNDITSP
jgi:hypothetical protein